MKTEDILSNLFDELFSERHSSQEPFEERKAEIIAKYSNLLSCQPVISEEHMLECSMDEYPNTYPDNNCIEVEIISKQRGAYIKGIKKGLSLSSNDKQEKKSLYEISDEDAIEVTKLANFHPQHQNAKLGKQLISEEGIVEYINAYEYLQIWQYLQFKGYELPVYYPEKKEEHPVEKMLREKLESGEYFTTQGFDENGQPITLWNKVKPEKKGESND